MSNIIKNKSAWYYRTDFFIYKIYYFFFSKDTRENVLDYTGFFSRVNASYENHFLPQSNIYTTKMNLLLNETAFDRIESSYIETCLKSIKMRRCSISILRQRRVRSSSSFVYLFLKTFSILRVISMMQGGGRKRRNPRWKVSVYPNERNLEEATNKRE